MYEQTGVREDWLFDTDRETARIYRRDGDRLVPSNDLSAAAGEVLETPILPGLAIPLTEIFR